MRSDDGLTVEEVLAAFDEHLGRVRGVCPGTRRNYARYVGEFLMAVFDDRGVEFAEVRAPEVASFIGGLSGRYQSRTVEHAATALRVFFRFLRAQGWCEHRLTDAVPMVPHRPSGLVRHLDPRVLEQLITSLETTSPRDLRDRAIILIVARVGLRPGEVAQLRLEDIDWRNAAIRVRSRKTGHGALVPLTSEVGAALADYLQNGRPDTDAREVFVLHWLRVGAPISTSIVGARCSARWTTPASTHRCLEATCCVTPWPLNCSLAAPACPRSPTCLGTPASPRPGSMPRSISGACARFRCHGRRWERGRDRH